MFSKNVWKSIVKAHPTFTMREVNSRVSELWKEVGDEDRRMYQQQAKENYALFAVIRAKRKRSLGIRK